MSRPMSITARRVADEANYAYVPPSVIAATPQVQAAVAPEPPAPEPEPTPQPEPEVSTYRANAGVPGDFTGGPLPPSYAVLVSSNVAPWPATEWDAGEWIVLGDGTEWTWDGTGWVESHVDEGTTP